MRELRISVLLGGVEHMLNRQEWNALVTKGNADWNKLKAKCPTCRCMLLPDDKCWCCAAYCDSDPPDSEPYL